MRPLIKRGVDTTLGFLPGKEGMGGEKVSRYLGDAKVLREKPIV